MTDRIELRGLRVVAVVGVLPEERERAQPFEVDLDVLADLAEAGRTDDLECTVDYGGVAAVVERVLGAEQPRLLERAAHRIAEEVLAFPRVEGVRVTVRKLRPPLPQDVATSAVTIERAR